MQDSSKEALLAHLKDRKFQNVLDAPSGGGWLPKALGADVAVDGIDLYVDEAPGYRKFWKFDHFFLINKLFIKIASISVRSKQSNASSGLETIGSFSLKDVLSKIGTFVRL